jgi:hypothetical protein
MHRLIMRNVTFRQQLKRASNVSAQTIKKREVIAWRNTENMCCNQALIFFREKPPEKWAAFVT